MRRRLRRLRTVVATLAASLAVRTTVVAVPGFALLASAAWWARSAGTGDVLLVGARVLTLAGTAATGGDGPRSDHDAVLVLDGRIAAIGRAESLRARPDARGVAMRTLGDVTLMPGFVDAHSHFPAVDLPRFGIDLTPPPDGTIDSLAGLYARLERAATDDDREERWLLGFDYDESGLAEARHPTRLELDAIVPSRPVWLRHRSGHMGVGNSAALAELGIDDDWAAPPGGRTSRDGAGRLDGLLQERAAPSLTRLLGDVPLRLRLGALGHARDVYLAAGVTTVQNGHASRGLEALLLLASAVGYLPQHVVTWRSDLAPLRPASWPDSLVDTLFGAVHALLPEGANAVPVAIKLIVDGSPQGRTAWLSEPYLAAPGQASDYSGVPALARDELTARVLDLHTDGWRLAIHTNGDAAADAALDALETALDAVPRDDHGHLLVHAQTVRSDQLRRMASLAVGASFFPGHVRYWGDWHRDRVLGAARAARISPLAEADVLGVDYSIHADTPVTPMRPFDLMAVATDRRLPSGQVLGPAYRIDRLRALRALTIDPARQAGLDGDRGSLEVGKRADLIAVAGDPLRDDPATLWVVGTWIDGRRRFAAP